MSGLLAKMMKARPDAPALKDDLEVIEMIHGSAQHMSEIVRGILMGEGLEQGGVPFAPAAVDLSRLAADIVKFNRLAAQRKNLVLREDVAPGLTLTADAKLLREAFDNYVSNAVKYSPPGRGIAVVLRALPGGGAEFAVQDEGPGLSAADRAQLYQKFKKLTPRPTAGESSTGLGLSIVKTIAELHGGSVGCDSEPGNGARFWLKLPARPPGNSGSPPPVDFAPSA
jgi:signal transduction histidine kinase